MGTAIIDADSFFYRAALTCKELVTLDKTGTLYYEAYNLKTAYKYLKDTADNIANKINCSDWVMVTGGVGDNFRLRINPTYKANRKHQAKPIMLDKVRDMAFKNFDVKYIFHLEADDTCRILLEQNKDNVIVSIDKDLQTVSGKIYDAYHDKIRYISPEQAENNFKRQLLMGDKSDGYDGLPKVGKATADKMILDGITIDDIAQKYIDCGLGLEEFERVYNSAKILGKNEYDKGIITLYGGKKLDVRDN